MSHDLGLEVPQILPNRFAKLHRLSVARARSMCQAACPALPPRLTLHLPCLCLAFLLPLPEPAEGTTFLLPLLLQVSDPAYAQDGGERQAAEQRLWLDALSQPNVLPLLVQYACHCVAASTPAVTLAAVAQADDALIYAVRLLLHLVTPPPAAASAAPAADDPAAAARQLRGRRRQLLLADGTLQLLHELLRVAKLRPAVPPVNCKPHELLDTARYCLSCACCFILCVSDGG